jgi:hypothetical protein
MLLAELHRDRDTGWSLSIKDPSALGVLDHVVVSLVYQRVNRMNGRGEKRHIDGSGVEGGSNTQAYYAIRGGPPPLQGD